MQKNLTIFILYFLFSVPLFAQEVINFDDSPLNEKIKKTILDGNIHTESVVKSQKIPLGIKGKFHKNQTMVFYSAGLHTKSCSFSLKKLSRYEDLSKSSSLIEESSYIEKIKTIRLLLSSSFLPGKWLLRFKIPRIKKPGLYPFTFEHGFLSGLQGNIHVSEYKNRCFFYLSANWEGKDTGIGDLTMEFITKSLANIIMEKLFRFSTTY